MRKIWKSSALLLGTAMLGAVALSGTNVKAEDVTVTVEATLSNPISAAAIDPLSFGPIGVDPGGDTIIVDAATDGATAVAVQTNQSDVSGVGSGPGVITITSAIDTGFTPVYDADGVVSLSNGTDSVPVTNIGTYSTGATTVTGGTPKDIYVGGEITLVGNESSGAYTTTTKVVLNYN